MRVWEAIEMLENMSPDREVTVTIGRKRQATTVPVSSGGLAHPVPPQPVWVIGKEFWPTRNEITCKMH